MTDIPIYNVDGHKIGGLYINDDVEPPIDDRVSKGKNCWYKGAGINYNFHTIPAKSFRPDVYDFVMKSPIFYIGYQVSKKAFQGKFGIFQEKYQTMFSDFIGTCGVKELSIIENSMFFERSSVKLLESVNYDKINITAHFYLPMNNLQNLLL